MASPACSPGTALSCSVCQMFSYTSTSFTDKGTHDKFNLFVSPEQEAAPGCTELFSFPLSVSAVLVYECYYWSYCHCLFSAFCASAVLFLLIHISAYLNAKDFSNITGNGGLNKGLC